MFSRGIYLKTMHDQWKLTAWIGFGLIAFSLYVTLLFPVIQDTSGLTEFMDQLPEFMLSLIGGALDFTQPEGFLNAELFSLLSPLIVLVYAVVRGGAAIAGEEERHTLDQLLANPVSRVRVLLEKAAAIETGILILCIIQILAVLAGAAMAGFSIDGWLLIQAHVSLFLMGSVGAMMAAGLGAAFGKRSMASGITAGIFIVGWLLNAVQEVVDVLQWTRYISFFWHYNGNTVLVNGLIAWRAAFLLAIATVALAAGAARFRARDLHG